MRNFFSVCKHAESLSLPATTTELYVLCSEDLLLTALPNIMFTLLALSMLCPEIVRRSTRFSVSDRSKTVATLCLWLGLFPYVEMGLKYYTGTLTPVTLIYILSQSLAWGLSSLFTCVIGHEKNRILKHFWLASLVGTWIKGLSRLHIEMREGFMSPTSLIQMLEGGCLVAIVGAKYLPAV